MNKSSLLIPIVAFIGCAHAPASNGVAARPAVQSGGLSRPKLASGSPAVAEDRSSSTLSCGAAAVHFDFDSAELGRSDRDDLERAARCLRENAAMHAVVSGNTDERGTEEYNLALGDRRAVAVAGYLESLGASPSQLEVVSYGEERPLCSSHDESCWATNRRALVAPSHSATEAAR